MWNTKVGQAYQSFFVYTTKTNAYISTGLNYVYNIHVLIYFLYAYAIPLVAYDYQ